MARSPVKRFFGTLLFVVGLLVTLGFLFVLYAASIGDSDFPLVSDLDTLYLVGLIALGVIIFVLLLILLIRRYDRRGAQSDDAEAFFIPDEDRDALARQRAEEFERAFADSTTYAAGPEIVVYNLPLVPLMGRAWDDPPKRNKRKPQPLTFTYYYPRSVESAVYTNEYIDIGGGDRVKLRILLAGPKDAEKKEFDPAHIAKKPAKKVEKKEEKKETTEVEPFVAATERDQKQLLLERTGSGPTSGDFMKELEERLARPREVVATPAEVFYDYAGDVHNVVDLEGIGSTYAARLAAMGIRTTSRLLFEETDRIADGLQVPRKTVEGWKVMAELVKVKGVGPQYAEAMARAGIGGVQELKKRSPATIAAQINEYLDSLETNVIGTNVTEKRVEGWQDAARDMRRVRMKVPVE